MLLVFIAAAAVAAHVPQLLANTHQDLFIYRTGADLALHRHSPYDTAALRNSVRTQYPDDPDLIAHCGFFLAPEAVLVFAPLAWLPWPVAKVAWTLLSVGLAALAIRQLGVFTDSAHVRRVAPFLAVGLLFNPVTIGGMAVGQTALLSFACIVLGESAHQAGWRRLGALLWAIPFIKPHLALPLIVLAWHLGGWRRAVELVLWVAGLNLAGSLVAGSPTLILDYVRHVSESHTAVGFNRVELNSQLTSWNRLLYALGGPAIELGAVGMLAGYALWFALVAGRVWLARSRPTPAWAVAAAVVGALLCCQAWGYELVLLGLAFPYMLELWSTGRREHAAAIFGLLTFVSLPYFVTEPVFPSHRSLGVAQLALCVLAFGWSPHAPREDS